VFRGPEREESRGPGGAKGVKDKKISEKPEEHGTSEKKLLGALVPVMGVLVPTRGLQEKRSWESMATHHSKGRGRETNFPCRHDLRPRIKKKRVEKRVPAQVEAQSLGKSGSRWGGAKPQRPDTRGGETTAKTWETRTTNRSGR